MPGDGSLDVLGKVVPRVPPIGDLLSERRSVGCGFGIGASPVPADHATAGMLTQPRGERFRSPVRQHIHRTAHAQVDEHGAVDMPPAQREIIHAEYRNRPDLRVRQRADQPQKRAATHRHAERYGHSSSRSSGKRQADLFEHAPQQRAAP
jgi:hypothetical protein